MSGEKDGNVAELCNYTCGIGSCHGRTVSSAAGKLTEKGLLSHRWTENLVLFQTFVGGML
jgi:hypothetical protein